MAVASMTSWSPTVSSVYTPFQEQRIPSPATSSICGDWKSLRQFAAPILPITRTSKRLASVRRSKQISCSLKDAEQLVRDGKVRCTWASEAQELIENEGYRVLDVRPVWEHERASAPSFLHVAVFVEEDQTSALTLVRKAVTMGFGGLWTGQRLTRRNERFVTDVQTCVPDKTTKLIVCCQEGLRSLLAVEDLFNAGYTNIAWMSGGFNVSKESDFPGVVGTTKLQFSSLGGVSSIFMKANSIVQDAANGVLNSITQK